MKEKQVSDSVVLGLLLALSGGCMDAYSYLLRGNVFANAQTGNILLFGVHLSEGKGKLAMEYFWPVLAFMLGIVASDVARYFLEKAKVVHWGQICLLLEIVALFSVSFMPQSMNALANGLTSFACGIQVESFRTIRGNGIATTMCIGNLRSGTFHLDAFIQTREKTHIRKALLYYGVIVFFVLGAILESVLLPVFGIRAILLSVLLLLLGLAYMFRVEK